MNNDLRNIIVSELLELSEEGFSANDSDVASLRKKLYRTAAVDYALIPVRDNETRRFDMSSDSVSGMEPFLAVGGSAYASQPDLYVLVSSKKNLLNEPDMPVIMVQPNGLKTTVHPEKLGTLILNLRMVLTPVSDWDPGISSYAQRIGKTLYHHEIVADDVRHFMYGLRTTVLSEFQPGVDQNFIDALTLLFPAEMAALKINLGSEK